MIDAMNYFFLPADGMVSDIESEHSGVGRQNDDVVWQCWVWADGGDMYCNSCMGNNTPLAIYLRHVEGMVPSVWQRGISVKLCREEWEDR